MGMWDFLKWKKACRAGDNEMIRGLLNDSQFISAPDFDAQLAIGLQDAHEEGRVNTVKILIAELQKRFESEPAKLINALNIAKENDLESGISGAVLASVMDFVSPSHRIRVNECQKLISTALKNLIDTFPSDQKKALEDVCFPKGAQGRGK